jgi:hypothetical protein
MSIASLFVFLVLARRIERPACRQQIGRAQQSFSFFADRLISVREPMFGLSTQTPIIGIETKHDET